MEEGAVTAASTLRPRGDSIHPRALGYSASHCCRTGKVNLSGERHQGKSGSGRKSSMLARSSKQNLGVATPWSDWMVLVVSFQYPSRRSSGSWSPNLRRRLPTMRSRRSSLAWSPSRSRWATTEVGKNHG